MKYLNFSFVLIFFFLSNCKGNHSDMVTVDVVQAFNEAQDLLLSDFVEHLEYVVLESENPIDRGLKVYSSDNHIICITVAQIYLFDRQTGKFIREIGRRGNGAGEYLRPLYFDSETKHIIAQSANLLEYDLNGDIIRAILQPKNENGTWRLSSRMFLDRNSIAYYVGNTREGSAKERLLVADEYGKVQRIFDNPNNFIQGAKWFVSGAPSVFYHHGGNTLFFEICVDTIYRVSKDALTPHYHLNMGKYKPPYEKQDLLFGPPPDQLINEYFSFLNIGESDAFLFFEITHKKNPEFINSFFGYYDKNRKVTKMADVGKTKRRIVNDIDNFDVIQLSSWTIDEYRNELISYIDAVDIVEWFESNPQQAKALPEHVQKLSQIKPDDDPVVVIAKLKR